MADKTAPSTATPEPTNEELAAFVAERRRKQQNQKTVEIVNFTLTPISIMPRGKGQARVLPLQRVEVPEGYWKQLQTHWKPRHGEKFNPVLYRHIQFVPLAKPGEAISEFEDKASGRKFQTCKQIGSYKNGTRQKGIELSVHQAQALIARLSTSEMIERYLVIDQRPLVQVYGYHVLQRRQAEERALRGEGRNLLNPQQA
jgi:hypothetical protein